MPLWYYPNYHGNGRLIQEKATRYLRFPIRRDCSVMQAPHSRYGNDASRSIPEVTRYPYYPDPSGLKCIRNTSFLAFVGERLPQRKEQSKN